MSNLSYPGWAFDSTIVCRGNGGVICRSPLLVRMIWRASERHHPPKKFAVKDTLAHPTRPPPIRVGRQTETSGSPQGREHPTRMVSSDYVLASSPPPTSTSVFGVNCVLRMFLLRRVHQRLDFPSEPNGFLHWAVPAAGRHISATFHRYRE